MAITIKDVAKRADVSVTTVSFVINGHHSKVSKSTLKKVLRVIDELNYHPSRQARGLVSRKTGNLGFIITEDHFSRAEPFYTKVFLGTEFETREFEYYVLLKTIPTDFDEESRLPRFVLERNVDGLILVGKIPTTLIQRLKSTKIPMVLVDYYLPDENFPVVLIDNIAGGYKAAMHLINCGHRRIAFVGGDMEHPSITERYQGYRMALEKSNIPFDPALVVVDETYLSTRNGYCAAQKLFSQTKNVTAIFACNDSMALGAMQFLKERGKKIPQEVSLIGFDDVESGLTVEPHLSTVRVPKIELGSEAVRLLMNKLQNNSVAAHKVLIPVDVIARESTCRVNGN